VAPEDIDCRKVLLARLDELTPEEHSVRSLLDACRDDPAHFQTEVLGRKLWSKQIAVCDAVARNPIMVVAAGRSVGKSYMLS
jgi:hypothetical protein